MNDIEERVRRYATTVLDAAPPVSAEEARARAGRSSLPRWAPLAAVAAAVLLIAAASAFVLSGNDEEERVTAGPANMPLTLDGHRDWHLAVLNGEVEATDDELRRRYSDDFLAAIPPERFRQLREAVAALGPWSVFREIERREDVLAVQLKGAGNEQARLTLMTGDDGRMVASTILAATPCATAVPPDTPLQAALAEQLEWVKALLASNNTPPEAELRGHLAPAFLTNVPPERFADALSQLRELAPYTYRHYEGEPLATSLTMRVGVHTGEEARLSLAIEPQPPHRITGFTILTQQPCRI